MRSRPSGASATGSAAPDPTPSRFETAITLLRRVIRQVGFPRALAEGTLFAAASLLLLARAEVADPNQVALALATLVSGAAAVVAIRLHRFTPTLRGMLAEAGCATLAAGWVAAIQYAYLWQGYRASYPNTLVWVPVLFGLLDSAVYGVIRFSIVGIPWWVRFQRRKLRWQLVNLQLLTVVVLVVVPMVAIGVIGVISASDSVTIRPDPPDSAFLSAVTALVTFAAVTVVLIAFALVAVLPPSIVISYIAARRTTRRLERLTGTAAALRDGDLAARVAVQGTDEVAQLQADVNAMAETMQRTIAELETERDRVRGLLHQRQELVASVSHELRTPVAIMRGYLDAALGRESALPPDVQRDLEVMHGESLRLQRLIDDLFALSRASVAQLPLRIEPVDPVAVLRQSVDATAPGAWQASRVDVLLEPAEDVPPIAVDPDRLQQIVLNVIGNAIRHSPPGGLVVVAARAEDDRVAIRVADTGDGIPAEELDRVWDRFYRGSNAQDPRGSGLGLALAKELAEAMGGAAAVASVPGEETVFTFTFPVADAAGADGRRAPTATESVPTLQATSARE